MLLFTEMQAKIGEDARDEAVKPASESNSTLRHVSARPFVTFLLSNMCDGYAGKVTGPYT